MNTPSSELKVPLDLAELAATMDRDGWTSNAIELVSRAVVTHQRLMFQKNLILSALRRTAHTGAIKFFEETIDKAVG